MLPLPTLPHDWGLWLFETLEHLEYDGDRWKGALPTQHDFEQIVDALPTALAGVSDAGSRTIEFHPTSVGVYETMLELVGGARRRAIPPLFTVRDLGYTHTRTAQIPELIAQYFNAVKLWSLLDGFADHGTTQSQSLYFIKTFSSKLEIRCEYGAEDLRMIVGLDEFSKNYFQSDHHKDQKRNLVRDALLETFKGQLAVKLSDLLPRFSEFAERVRNSYTLYTADFSFEKLRSEVDKQNLEDMLRLNKTLSEIQNQLLALPAAMLLVGASVKSGNFSVNASIVLGVSAFVWIMRNLLRNQLSSVEAIEGEIDLRKAKISQQPEEIASDLLPRFTKLHQRIRNQTAVLNGIRRSIWGVWLVTVAVVANEQWPFLAPSLWEFLATHSEPLWAKFSSLPGEVVGAWRAISGR